MDLARPSWTRCHRSRGFRSWATSTSLPLKFFFYLAAKDAKLKNGEQKIQECLLEGAKKYLAPLQLENQDEKVKSLCGRADWILFRKDAAVAEEEAAATHECAPSVIQFDEMTGQQLNTQTDFAQGATKEKKETKLPQKLP